MIAADSADAIEPVLDLIATRGEQAVLDAMLAYYGALAIGADGDGDAGRAEVERAEHNAAVLTEAIARMHLDTDTKET